MTNLERRLRKLEFHLSDPSGLVPHSQEWLEYWDRQLYLHMTNQPKNSGLFSIEALRAALKYTDNPASLAGAGEHVELIDSAATASQANTAACSVCWRVNEATVEWMKLNVADEMLLGLASSGDKVGIDVPFGWPDAFVHAVTAHHAGRSWSQVASRDLRLRQTDVFVWKAIGKQPLSVSTDKIGIPALRMASLMSKLAQAGTPIDRTGAGRFVEVYPAAALRRWGIANAKKETPMLLPALLARAPWLKLTKNLHELCVASRDACDALVAALAVRAAAIGQCEPIPEERRRIAAVEDWIALPVATSLSRLTGASTA